MTASVLAFADDDGGYHVVPYCWLPGETLRRARGRGPDALRHMGAAGALVSPQLLHGTARRGPVVREDLAQGEPRARGLPLARRREAPCCEGAADTGCGGKFSQSHSEPAGRPN